MHPVSRRTFLSHTTAAAPGLALALTFHRASAATAKPRRFTLDLTPGSIGVGGDLLEHLRLAHHHSFESVQPDTGFLVRQDADGLKRVQDALAQAGLKWGAANLPVEFRQTDEVFQRDLASLAKVASALKAVGASRIGTWLSPGHGELPYRPNLERHASRLREVSKVLRDQGIRLGLEYVGTPSLRARVKHEFIHNLAGARELVAAIDVPGTGFVLDSWHWWTSGDSADAVRKLRGEEVIAVDLNDAPAGVPLEQQQDNRREIPTATGVIPVKTFLQCLVDIGYDGPVRVEPFNKALNDLDNDAACAKCLASLRKAVALLGD